MKKETKPRHRPKRKYANAKRQVCQPELKICPCCSSRLISRGTLYINKQVQTLRGPINVRAYGYQCSNEKCEQAEKRYRAVKEVMKSSLPGVTYGLDTSASLSTSVIALIGWQRDKEHKQFKEIHQKLEERGIEISERHVGRLYRQYLALLGGMNEEKGKRLKEVEAEYGGVVWALDGLQPDKNGPQMYVLYEILSGEVVAAAWFDKRDQAHLAGWLKPYGELKLNVLATLSDGEEAEIGAMERVWSEKPHQMCQIHFLGNIAKPVEKGDRQLRAKLKESMGKLPPIPGSESTAEAGPRARTLELEPVWFEEPKQKEQVEPEAKTGSEKDRGVTKAESVNQGVGPNGGERGQFLVAKGRVSDREMTVREGLQALDLEAIQLCETAVKQWNEGQQQSDWSQVYPGNEGGMSGRVGKIGSGREEPAGQFSPGCYGAIETVAGGDQAVLEVRTAPLIEDQIRTGLFVENQTVAPDQSHREAVALAQTRCKATPLSPKKPGANPDKTASPDSTSTQLEVRLRELEQLFRQAFVDALHRPSRKPSTFGGLAGYAQLQGLVSAFQSQLPTGDTSYLTTLLKQGQQALAETAELASQLHQAQDFLQQITHLLSDPLKTKLDFSSSPPPLPETEERADHKIKQALTTKLTALAKQAQPGSVAQALLDNTQRLTTKWEPYLFNCYHIPALPAHNNALEFRFNQLRSSQRRVSGRKETSALRRTAHFQILFPASSVQELEKRLSLVSLSSYQTARQRLDAAEERQRWLYRLHRWPDKTSVALVKEYLHLQHQLNSLQPTDT
ncbi:MAG: hypothetical protein GY942_24985 [Aestuariibacter sp.]|nr:hypothetical protein [Aestuariibacter sp.]